MKIPREIIDAMGGRLPTDQQWDAISHSLEPCAVIAGAGSGKTAVMAARVVWLALEKHAMPSQVLCLTFTNKACEELTRRVRHATGGLGLPEGEEATVLTYHAFAQRLLDDYGMRMGIEPGAMLLTEAHKWQIGTGLLDSMDFDRFEVRTVGYVTRLMLGLADRLCDHRVTPADLEAHSVAFAKRAEVAGAKGDDRKALEAAQKRVELSRFVAAYRAQKGSIHAIDFGDMIRLAHDLVAAHPEVAEEFRERYRAVLLDEYQDTNHAQGEILKALCGRGMPVMAVGDPDQNIYAWRGASLRNILRFGDDFGGSPLPLNINFRSGSKILDAANAVIGPVPAAYRGEDKKLEPHPPNGPGRVLAFAEADENAEGRRIAQLIASMRSSDAALRFGDFAILCRKKRLFIPIYEALVAAGVPTEVVDLGGLLQLPEVVEVSAWLRVLDDPGRNIALARLLQGRRWRIGYRDLVALARWGARQDRTLREALTPEGEEPGDMPGDVAFALAESLDHLDEIPDLSDEARARLVEFRALLTSLRVAASGPLDELVAAIAERSGLLRELEVASSDAAAVGARRNLLNFIGSVSAFSPVEGRATLATLVAYLDAAEEAEEEFEQAQLSDDNTVKVMTIHKAKGLEWPVVFVPGLAHHDKSPIFPDTGRQPNPMTQAEQIPFELRGDADVLPAYPGRLDRFRELLAERALEEERRLAYVALTRAKQTLVVSHAWWYTGPSDAYSPCVFYNEVCASGVCEVLECASCPDESPLIEARAARVPSWPLPAREDDADSLFPAGWHAAEIAGDASAYVGALSARERAAYEERLASHRERIALVRARAGAIAGPALPRRLSVSAMLEYERCPKLFSWSNVRPLPRRPSAAARLGTEVHRWIERRALGASPLFEIDEPPDLDLSERAGGGGTEAELRKTFEASRFGSTKPLYSERPFLLWLDGFTVGGRVDAIFGTLEGAWEIVDYKTGSAPDPSDPVPGLQLDLYALAAMEIWGKKPEDLTLTFFYMSENKIVSCPAGDAETIRKRALASLAGMSAGAFEAAPGDHCRWCDFLAFCEHGARYLRELPRER